MFEEPWSKAVEDYDCIHHLMDNWGFFPVQRPTVPGTYGSLPGSDPAKPYGSPRVPEPHPGEPGQQHQHFAMQVRNMNEHMN